MRNALLFIMIILSFLSLPAQAQERPPAIVTFEAADDVIVTVNEAEQRSLTTTLSWDVINFTIDHQLAIHAYAVNDWLPLYEGMTLRPVETRNAPLIHPLNFGPITYRLSVLTNSGTLVDQRFIHIDFTAGNEPPSITLFEVYDTSPYDEFHLNAELVWEVDNRIPYSNIEFDQILPDGQIQSIELPRLSLWVSSSGNGQVRPFYTPDFGDIRVRMRVVNVRDGTVYDSQETIIAQSQQPNLPDGSIDGGPLIVTPTPTTQPAPSDGSVPGGSSGDEQLPDGSESNPSSEDGARLQSFSVSPQPINRSRPLNVSWQVDHATRVTLHAMHFITKSSQPYWSPATHIAGATVTDLSPQGKIQYTLPLFFPQDSIRFRLEAVGIDGNTYNFDSETINLQTFPMFFETSLTSTFPPKTSVASYQEFESGVMIWRGTDNVVFVLSDSIEATGFFWKTFTGSEVAITENPPEGLFSPEDPFTGVWQNNTNVKALGWATSPMQSYTMQWQWKLHPLYSFQDVSYMSTPNGVARLNYFGSGAAESGPGWVIE